MPTWRWRETNHFPVPRGFVVKDLTVYKRNVVLFQNQNFATSESMSRLKGEGFLWFSHNHAQTQLSFLLIKLF